MSPSRSPRQSPQPYLVAPTLPLGSAPPWEILPTDSAWEILPPATSSSAHPPGGFRETKWLRPMAVSGAQFQGATPRETEGALGPGWEPLLGGLSMRLGPDLDPRLLVLCGGPQLNSSSVKEIQPLISSTCRHGGQSIRETGLRSPLCFSDKKCHRRRETCGHIAPLQVTLLCVYVGVR